MDLYCTDHGSVLYRSSHNGRLGSLEDLDHDLSVSDLGNRSNAFRCNASENRGGGVERPAPPHRMTTQDNTRSEDDFSQKFLDNGESANKRRAMHASMER